MSLFDPFGARATKKKIKKTKQKVRDVKALVHSARGNQVPNRSAQKAVNRAAGRLGVNPGMQFPVR